jgi:hypothetical protein
MKVLIIGTFHHKNKEGLEQMLSYLNYEYKWGTYNDIPNYDLIFLPDNPIDTSKFPNKKFIFGNHFSVFPTNKLLLINNIHNNSIYIQPSIWASRVWKDMHAEKYIPVKTLPFAVNIDKFSSNNNVKHKVFIYFKARKQNELELLTSHLKEKNVEYVIFDYRKRYSEIDYIKYLHESKYGIWVGRHESQGFALQEALSMNVPLLVWDVTSMNQEEGYNYPEIPGTVIPYFDKRCGDYFYKEDEFVEKYNEFISKLSTYKPREFVLENLSVDVCGERLKELINL